MYDLTSSGLIGNAPDLAVTFSEFTYVLLVCAICIVISVPQIWLMYRLGRRDELGLPTLLLLTTAVGCALLIVGWFVAIRWITIAGVILVLPLLTSAVTLLLALLIGSLVATVLGASRAVAKHLR